MNIPSEGDRLADRITLSEELQSQLLDPEIIPAEIFVGDQKYTPNAPIGSGYKSVVWKVTDRFGRPRALKLAIFEDYKERSFLEEIQLTTPLEQYEQFARLIDADIVELVLPDNLDGRFVAFVEEWIDGVTLERFLKQSNLEISSSFFLSYVNSLTSALSALQTNNLRHDDLHIGNVMIAQPARGDIAGEHRIKIIDTGSLKPASTRTKKPKDDHRHFVEHLVAIRNAIHNRRSMPARERRFISEADNLIQTMLDDDPSIALRDPIQIRDQVEMAITRASLPAAGYTRRLSSPFEFLSAEHIADDRLLIEMFANSCPWIEKVVNSDPCLVTGPRGCGKSTLFRWLSLKAHLSDSENDIKEHNLAGFYISCATDLQNRFDWIRSPTLADDFAPTIIHYFNLLLTREVLRTLDLLDSRKEQRDYWGYGLSQERALREFVFRHLQSDSLFQMQGVSLLKQTLEAIEKEMFNTHSQMMKGLSAASPLPPTFLGDFTDLLCQIMPRFQENKIAFLLDDYSTHRLPASVQRVLNRVIWERRASHIFKLSSEKHGAELRDPERGTADIARDMVEIDCGREYLALDDARKTRLGYAFATDLLNNRLKAAGYEATAEQLIGVSSWEEGTLANALVSAARGRRTDRYHGLSCVAAVCSGDVSTLLLIYRRMFETAGVSKQTTEPISKTVQSTSIRNVSREMLESIKIYFPKGPDMYDLVSSFGKFIRAVLEHGREQTKGDKTVPSECPRIEIDQVQGDVIQQLTSSQQNFANELVRRAIFIDMAPGLSRHQNLTTLRWQLRRIYLPAFGASLAKNNAVKQDPEWFRFFLTNPAAACKMVFDTWPKQASPDGIAPRQARMTELDSLSQDGDLSGSR